MAELSAGRSGYTVRERMAENFAIFDFQLKPEDTTAIAAFDLKTSQFFDHRDPEAVKGISIAVRNA